MDYVPKKLRFQLEQNSNFCQGLCWRVLLGGGRQNSYKNYLGIEVGGEEGSSGLVWPSASALSLLRWASWVRIFTWM